MSDGGLDITVCIPVYNDAASGRLLLQELDRVAASLPHRFQVLFVDDGSTEEECRALPGPSERIAAVEVLRLRRTLGHQRAIAVGLSAIAARGTADADRDSETVADRSEASLNRSRLQALLVEGTDPGPHVGTLDAGRIEGFVAPDRADEEPHVTQISCDRQTAGSLLGAEVTLEG